MKPFKFFQKERNWIFNIPVARRMSGRTIANDLVQVQPLGPPDNDVRILRNSLYGAFGIKEVAVISASLRDFANWRRDNFTPSEVLLYTGAEFLFTDPHNNITTRYRAILNESDCRGLFFDGYVKTDRTEEILRMYFHDDYLMDHIRQLISEVRLHIRQENNI